MAVKRISSNVFLLRDVVNVYVVKSGSKAVLIDCGNGKVVDYLQKLDIKKIDYVFFTHHHREQCQGWKRVAETGARMVVPHSEKSLFSNVFHYWQKDFLYKHECIGAPYVRPLIKNMNVFRYMRDQEVFSWNGLRLKAISTPGHSPGAMSYLYSDKVFCGDCLYARNKLVNLYDSEWDYGYCAGLKENTKSLFKIAEFSPRMLLPSHGKPIVKNPINILRQTAQSLDEFINRFYLRAWGDHNPYSNNLSNPAKVKQVAGISSVDEVLPHLLRAPGNMYIIIGKGRKAILLDTGCIKTDKAIRILDNVISRYKLTEINAMLLSHYHYDHHDKLWDVVRDKYGVKLFAFENMVQILEHPERYNLTCLHHCCAISPRNVDRIIYDGETFELNGIRFHAFRLPGQTVYGMGLAFKLDAKWIASTGDNIFFSADLSGHDAFIMRNKGILEKGYIECARKLLATRPDLIIGGHGTLIENPTPQIRRLNEWANDFRKTIQKWSPYECYEWVIDPYWVELFPYRNQVRPGQKTFWLVKIRNYLRKSAVYEIEFYMPGMWEISIKKVKELLLPSQAIDVPVFISIPRNAKKRRYPVALNVKVNKKDFGQIFDGVIEVL